MVPCPICKTEFEPKRPWQKYDKDRCRKLAYWRRVTVKPEEGKNLHAKALAQLRWQKAKGTAAIESRPVG
jgi:hypothetical protein